MKKYISVFMILILIFVSIIPVNASVSEFAQQESVTAPVLLYQKGDLNGDGRITAEDARLCLRAAVGLEELNEKQLKAADLSENGTINSSSARFLLRASVGLEQLNSDIERPDRDSLVIGPFLTAGSGRYSWKCTVTPYGNVATVQQTTYDISAPGTDGGPVAQYFHIHLKSFGTFSFVFELNCSGTDEVLQQYTLIIQRGKIEDFPIIV